MINKRKVLLPGIIAVVLTGFLASCALFYPAGLYRDVEKYSQAAPIIVAVPVASDYQNGFDNPIIYQSKLYFMGNSSMDSKLYVIGDLGDYSIRTLDISDYTNGFNYPVIFDGLLFFGGTDPATFNARIFQYNGSTFTYYTTYNAYSYGYESPVIFNNMLYFQGIDTNSRFRVFSLSGGTISEPVLLGNYSNSFYNPIVYGDELIFQGMDVNYIPQSYKIDLYSNVSNFTTVYTNFVNPFLFNGDLYFAAYDWEGIDKVRKYDGNTVSSLSGDGYDYYFNYAKIYNNKLFFSGNHTSGAMDYPFYIGSDGSIHAMPVPKDFDSEYSNPQIFQNKLYFNYYSTNTSVNFKLGVYDDSTQMPASLFYINGIYTSDTYYAYNDTHLFFLGVTNTNASYLSNATPTMYAYLGESNIIQVSNSSDYVFGIMNPFVFNGEIYFMGYDSKEAAGIGKLYKITFPGEK